MGKNCNNTGKFKKIQQPLHLYNIKTKTMELCMMELIFNRKWPIAAKPRNLLKSTCMRNVHDIMLFLQSTIVQFCFFYSTSFRNIYNMYNNKKKKTTYDICTKFSHD